MCLCVCLCVCLLPRSPKREHEQKFPGLWSKLVVISKWLPVWYWATGQAEITRTEDGARWSFASHSMPLLNFLMDSVLLWEKKLGSVFCQLTLMPKIEESLLVLKMLI